MDEFNFYRAVLLDEQLFFNVTPDQMKESFNILKRSYNRRVLKKGKSLVNFHLPSDRCAYLYKFGPGHTQLVSKFFRKFLENARNVYSTLKKKEELKICCLGGGPGTDVVGMFEVLASHKKLWTKLTEVTVLDICGGWRNSFKRIIQKLKEIYPGQENLLASLISVDLMGDLSPSAIIAIEEADILCMVKFVSTVIFNPSAESAFKELASHMKTDAVVIFIDNLDNRIYKPLKNYLNESGLKCIFRDFQDQFKVQGNYPLNFKDLEGSEIMEYANVYVLGWIKKSCPESVEIHEESSESPWQNSPYLRNGNNEGDNYSESDDNVSDSDDDEIYDDDDDVGGNNFSCNDSSAVDEDCQHILTVQYPQLSSSHQMGNGISDNHNSNKLPFNISTKKLFTDDQSMQTKIFADQCTQTVTNSEESCSQMAKNDADNFISSETLNRLHGIKHFTDQCTQTVPHSEGLCSYPARNAVRDNFSSNELLHTIEGTRLCTDQCTQTVKLLCGESSSCANQLYLQSFDNQLSRIALCLNNIEFLIKNIAFNCNKKCCDEAAHCSNKSIICCNTSGQCHCANH